MEREFDEFFLHENEKGKLAYLEIVQQTVEILLNSYPGKGSPYNGKTPEALKEEIERLAAIQAEGESAEIVMREIGDYVVANSIHVTHPTSMAHLHCPPLIPALAAEMVISQLNQSMDSWDQSMSATYVEEKMVKWLCQRMRLSDGADGTFTSGGTQSNYMGLLLARNSYCEKVFNTDVKRSGLPKDGHRLRILCSENAHFTVKKSASQLGLGEDAVLLVKTDEQHRLCTVDLQKKLSELKEQQLLPIAIVATCGTTDFGSIDPLVEIADIANEHEIWLHIDAAYGGAFMLSHENLQKIAGLELADSVTIDFHKLFYQPISCGAFFVKDSINFKYIQHYAEYLNPEEDEEEGIPHLVNKSIQTTRRFDALKLYVSLKILGTKRFGEMIDRTVRLAKQTAALLRDTKDFSLLNPEPELNALVFRYEPADLDPKKLNKLSRFIHRELWQKGIAVAAKTTINQNLYLKFTLLNPRTTLLDIQKVVHEITALGKSFTEKEGKSFEKIS
ncbi:pyridoxal phosphate-dependent decarboxylase family protein [Metabacillus arenae]|uniref:pyridoxal phosphate-dependent decarboxylase family protein n=1 Tax=Metabacillus arenae TaxID=2771434 RepID=UPI002964F657|nr:aspartate aminotransferase family protein [Metabacillus arenae]